MKARRFVSGALNALEAVADLFLISALWLLCCLPVVTAATSSAALYYAAVKSVRFGRESAVKAFWHSFKANIRQGLPLSVIFAACCGFNALYFLLGRNLGSDTGLLISYWAAVAVVLFIFISTSVYAFALLSRFGEHFSVITATAFFLAVTSPLKSLGLIGLLVVGAFAVYCFPPALFIAPGLFALTASFLIEAALRARMKGDAGTLWEDPDRQF